MAAVEWQENLALGHGEIDEQHREIFRQFVAFSEACRDGRPEAELLVQLAFLQGYIRAHFDYEERLMTDAGYPETERQRRQHAEFGRDLASFAARLRDVGAKEDLALVVKRRLIHWIMEHICNLDRDFVNYLHPET